MDTTPSLFHGDNLWTVFLICGVCASLFLGLLDLPEDQMEVTIFPPICAVYCRKYFFTCFLLSNVLRGTYAYKMQWDVWSAFVQYLVLRMTDPSVAE